MGGGRAQSGVLTLALLVVLGLLLAGNQGLLAPFRDVVTIVTSPLQAGTARVGNVVATLVGQWAESGRLREDNEVLRAQSDELVRENIRLRALDLENRDLREQLQFAESSPALALVGAQIMSFDQSAISGYVTIDRGADFGVVEGMPIMSAAGLVGRVVSSFRTTSTALLITHPSSSVNAYVLGMVAATGVVNGTPDGRLVMKYLPPSEKVVAGSIVVTSGLGGGFPRNLPIGRVVLVEARDIDPFQQAVLEPLVDFRRVLTVLIARGFVPNRG